MAIGIQKMTSKKLQFIQTVTRTGLLLVTGASMGISANAWADVSGTFASEDGELRLEYRNDDNFRLRSADDGFLIMTDGSGYVVNRDEDGWVVIPMASIKAMVARFNDASDNAAADDYTLKATGRTERVVGIPGEVYEIQQCDAWSGDCTSEGEIVLSEDRRAVQLTSGLRAMAGMLGDSNQAAWSDMSGALAGKGMLRGPGIELTAVDSSPLPDRTFALPPNHRVIDPAAQGMQLPSSGQARSGGGADAGDEGGGWLGDVMREMGGEATNEAEKETKRGMRNTVRDGVRSLFN